jgi:hypothetical protein
MSIIYNAITMLFGTKQKENESLQDYTKWFRVSRDVLESHMGGPIILTKVVEAMPGYDESIVSTQETRQVSQRHIWMIPCLCVFEQCKQGQVWINSQGSQHPTISQ